ncbi:MAG: class I SAM-dependent methyltransferase [Gammaproteobacteria bacterium]|nr:class I SAM-dependent methyltransferase [Gammaproteobacteria bacterium]
MANSSRWKTAQSYEKEYWKGVAEKIASDASQQLTWYEWKASEFEKKLEQVDYSFNKENCNVLEVGSGPIGIVSYLGWGERVSIDPLGDFYKNNKDLVAVRDSNVNYITGKGEEIPYPDKHFSVVIIDNVLDHVDNAEGVLNEIHRVLSDDGVLYMELNVHTYWGFLLHVLLAKLNIDKGHPYSFTPNRIRKFLSDHKFTIKKDWINSYLEARDEDRKSDSLKAKIKGYSGLSEFIFFALCSKTK